MNKMTNYTKNLCNRHLENTLDNYNFECDGRSDTNKIYYSVKNKIIIINILGIGLDHPQLGIKISVTDSIEPVLAWIEKNGHHIIYQRNRSEK